MRAEFHCGHSELIHPSAAYGNFLIRVSLVLCALSSWWLVGFKRFGYNKDLIPLFIIIGSSMKPDIHPSYNPVHVKCSCGNEFDVYSSYPDKEMHIEVCAVCHPFYTGKQKILDSTGQVDKFHKRFGDRKTKTARPTK